MNSELVCVVANLGYYDGEVYFKGSDCLESLKDLLRFLRKEDESCEIRRQLGHSQVLQKDLLPLLISETEDNELIDMVVRLLVNLTSPADICFNKKPEEAEEVSEKQKPSSSYQTNYLEVVNYLISYKEAFTEQKVLAAIASHLGAIMQMDNEDRGEDELLMFERLLVILRNVLHVPSNPNEEKRTEDDVSVHDQVLWNFHVNGIDDIIIYIASSPDQVRWSMHALEIVNLMLREQNPEKLALASKTNNKTEDARAFLVAKEKEEALKKVSSKKIANTRHSRFGGSFWVMNLKGVGNKTTLVQHKHVTSVDDISFDQNKYPAKVSKRKKPANETTVERSSTLSIRLFLKEFCERFLEICYNHLMRVVKNNIVGKLMQENDETYYFWAVRFFMSFNRAHLFKVEYVSETINMNMFHYVLKGINNYFSQLDLNKTRVWQPWQKRLHSAVQAYKELLTWITNMDRSQDTILKDASSIIKNNVFYHEEYRNIFLLLIRSYAANMQSKKYLADLIETFHIFLKLLEKFCGEKGSILTKTKKKVIKRHKKVPTNQKQKVFSEEQLQDLWENEIAPSLSSILQGNDELPEYFESVFDPSSEILVEEQSHIAMIRIQDLLRAGKLEGVSLLRASREVWPEEKAFGSQAMNPEEEFMVVRNLLFKELNRVQPTSSTEVSTTADNDLSNEELNEHENEEEELVKERTVEREFYLNSFITSLATHQMVGPYCFLLKHFHSNSHSTNHAIAKMMHRVAVNLKLPEMFFQLSVFITFKQILEDPSKQLKELADFAKYIINKFVETSQTNPNIFVEALFWKGSGDCYQISEREGDDTRNHSVKTREKWTFEEEEQLKELYNQHKENKDVIEEILKSTIAKDRTKRQIINKLVRLRLIENAKELPKEKKVKQPKWSEEQTEELLRCFEEFKQTNDPVANIMAALTFPKSKNMIIKHLLETGKVADKKELYKNKKSKKKDSMNGDKDSSHDDNDTDDDDDDVMGAREEFHPHSAEGLSHKVHVENCFESIPYNENKFVNLCCQLKQKGYSQQIIWLQTRLRRAAEGREEDDDWYPVPLLTLTEDDEKALCCEDFQILLKMMGLKPPADEQEAFWRVPESLSPLDLKHFADILEKTSVLSNGSEYQKSGELESIENPNEIKTSKSIKREHSPTDSEDDSYEKYIKTNRKIKRNKIIDETSDSEHENNHVPLTSCEEQIEKTEKEELNHKKVDEDCSLSENSNICDYSTLDFSLRVSEDED
nr:protein timeless homolog isoform X1 [Hydra vulgaris]